jgi:chloramphenicol-sensitive protein RarD
VTDGHDHRRSGVLYGLAAYGLWGLMPIYFAELNRHAGPFEVLAQRIVWSFIFLAALLTGLGRWPDLGRCFRSRQVVLHLGLSTVLIAINWFAFIYGVWTNRVLETSLGYFMTPLFSVLLGMLFLQERPRPWQWGALALATAGIAYLVGTVGAMPWIALTLTGAFGFYGLVRKQTPVDALVGLSVETLLLLPPCTAAIVMWAADGTGAFGRDVWGSGLLASSGVVTAVPLLFFGAAARRLPLIILGFLQYIAPSLSCLVAVVWLKEPFRHEQQISFALIWAALAIFSAESYWAARRTAAGLRPPNAPAPEVASALHTPTTLD